MMKKHMVTLIFISTLAIIFCNTLLAGPIRYTVGGYAAALTEDLLDRVVELSVAEDFEALQKILDSGYVIILKKGIKVDVVETKLLSGKVKIRPFGTNLELWTLLEAIE